MAASLQHRSWELQFQLSPITLTRGVAANMPGQVLPVIAITDNPNFDINYIITQTPQDPDNLFAHYMPLPNSTLIENQYGTYPFANQQVAANAVVVQPLSVSILMTCPVRQPAGYFRKLAVMSALQRTLANHSLTGGTYAVMTPSFLYIDMLLLKLSDVSRGDVKQSQMQYQWDFFKPLISLEDAAAAQNDLIQKLHLGLVTDGTWRGDIANTSGTGLYPTFPPPPQ